MKNDDNKQDRNDLAEDKKPISPDKKAILDKLGEHIKEHREAQGWSTSKLAKETDVSIGLISRLETKTADSIPKASALENLAHALRISSVKLKKMVGYITEADEKELLIDVYDGLKGKNTRDILAWAEQLGCKTIRNELAHDVSGWKIQIRSILADNGFKKEYIDEIINYTETVKIKQEVADNKWVKAEPE